MLLPFILSRSDFLWVAEPVDLENELRNALSACWTIPTWGKGEIGTRTRARVRKKIRMLLGVVSDNSPHRCCLCSWSSRRTWFIIVNLSPMIINISDKGLHKPVLNDEKKLKTCTYLWCNDDKDEKNLYSFLMHWWQRWQKPVIIFDTISILASELFCRASHCCCLFSQPWLQRMMDLCELILLCLPIVPTFKIFSKKWLLSWFFAFSSFQAFDDEAIMFLHTVPLTLTTLQSISWWCIYLFRVQAQGPSQRIYYEQDRTCPRK